MSKAELVLNSGIAWLTMADPQAGNALGGELVEDLHLALDEVEKARPRAFVLRGAGKGFCGGLNLRNLEAETDASLAYRLIRIELFLQRMTRLPMATFALAHNFAYGAGADIVVACRHRIAAPRTRFAFPGVQFGIALGTGRLGKRCGVDIADKLLHSCQPISTEAALAARVLTDVWQEEDWQGNVEAAMEERILLQVDIEMKIAGRLYEFDDDADLSALARTVAVPGLKERIADYVSKAKARRS